MVNSSPFWSAYSSAVKNYLLPGVTPPKDNELFVLPFTVPFTDATGPLTDEDVNYLVYTLANTTLASDGSSRNYTQELSTYLNTVDESSLLDPDAKMRLDDAEKALDIAQKNFDITEADARAQYDLIPPPKPPFETWVLQNWPPYAADKRILNAAKAQYTEAYNMYWRRIKTFQGNQEGLRKALDSKTLHQSYNMSVRKDGGSSTFAPYYFSLDLKDQVNDWMRGGGQLQTFFEIKIDSATPPGGQAREEIYLKLTTKGISKFDIDAGQWNVDGVKTLYPKREPGAPNVLDPKYARPISFLVAYGIKLEVEIKKDGGQNTKLNTSAITTPLDNKPYAAVLGILGQHFPTN